MRKSLKYMAKAVLFVSTFCVIEAANYGCLKPIAAYAESDAEIKSITLSGGYSIDFSKDKYSYVLDVNEDTDAIVVRAKPLYNNDKILINGIQVAEEDKYRQVVELQEGKNKIDVQIKDAYDDSYEKTYTIYVYRGIPDAVYLKDINIDDKSIGFDKNKRFYNVELDEDTEYMKLTTIREDPNYTIKVNDKQLSSNDDIKIKFKGIGKYVINATVKDEETQRERVYNLNIYVGIPISPDVTSSVKDKLKPNQWVLVNGRWTYNDSMGEPLKSTWLFDSKYQNYFYFNERGYMHTGWLLDDGNYYYLDNYGAMQRGWLKYNNKWYYLNNNGAMETDWLKYDDKWYLFDNSGEMKTGWVVDDNKWYFLNYKGEMKTGWILDNKKWYYLDEHGVMQTGWLDFDNDWYFMNNDGSMKSGEWAFNNGNWYYINYSGTMRSGWLYKDDKYYYLNEDGTMQTSTKVIDGYEYNFNEDGSVNFNYR
ncbi:cadherin-like beta sandwich domain-containing protein [Clostridium saccharobutylicum]|uniref:Autolysin n=1 Tax=Clostridium saccharobutylicum TaxID=169679 RepID=A0A1S8NJ86_CLOSA|nr:cadherin-like beta sandwich domain-containing protein [Clostridium saccharobutylicum]OOM16510.1 autolysin [Clostridium saccharobutylicum]